MKTPFAHFSFRTIYSILQAFSASYILQNTRQNSTFLKVFLLSLVGIVLFSVCMDGGKDRNYAIFRPIPNFNPNPKPNRQLITV